MANIYSCYGSGCPYERPDGECKKPHYIDKCPSDMTDEEFEDIEFYKEYWQDLKFEEARGN
jgi:hypothetical protein